MTHQDGLSVVHYIPNAVN